MNLIEYPDRDLLMLDLADSAGQRAGRALAERDRDAFGAGRHDAGAVFDVLCAQKLDWDGVAWC
jgi:6-phosphogluconolactonase